MFFLFTYSWNGRTNQSWEKKQLKNDQKQPPPPTAGHAVGEEGGGERKISLPNATERTSKLIRPIETKQNQETFQFSLGYL